MISFKEYLQEVEEYVGQHEAPDSTNGAPMHDVSKIYPEDIHSAKAHIYYGDNGGDAKDRESIGHIQIAKNKPLHQVKIYRAVPHITGTDEQIAELEKHKAYILKRGRIPPNVNTNLNKSDYYEYAHNKIEELKLKPSVPSAKINPGDWVTPNRTYAKEHGEAHLNGKYKILSKTVPAKHLYTDGNSVHEWGYDPRP